MRRLERRWIIDATRYDLIHAGHVVFVLLFLDQIRPWLEFGADVAVDEFALLEDYLALLRRCLAVEDRLVLLL